MKNIVLIIFAILFIGCVPERQDGPAIDTKKILNCPDLVDAAAKNLEKFKIDPSLIQSWKKNTLSQKMQPCSACQMLNTAAYVLTDENDIYKPAMLDFIKNVEKEDPNKVPTPKPYISESKIDSQNMRNYALAQQYMDALENLQAFLAIQLRMPVPEAKNFVLDNYFVPLVAQDEKAQNPNQPPPEIVDPNNL